MSSGLVEEQGIGEEAKGEAVRIVEAKSTGGRRRIRTEEVEEQHYCDVLLTYAQNGKRQ